MTHSSWTRRDFLRRTALGAVIAGSGSAVLAACSSTGGGGGEGGGQTSKLDQLKSAGTITVGFAGEVPYAYNKGGDLVGEAPAVHKAIWQAAGIENMKGVQVDFDQLIPGLKAQRFDTVAAGMFILPDRCAQAAFSDPVYVAPEAFLVPKGNPDNLTDFKSAKSAGIKLGVEPGTSERTYVKALGIPDSKIVEINGQRDALAALKAGRIDAFSLTGLSLEFGIVKDNPDANVEVTEGFIPVIDGEKKVGAGAAVFRNEDDDLRDAFNTQLGELKDSGKLVDLISPFGFSKENIPPDDVTTEKLCQG